MLVFLVIFLLNPGTAGAARRLAALPLLFFCFFFLLLNFFFFFFLRASFSFFLIFKGEETIDTANIIQRNSSSEAPPPRWTELLPDWWAAALRTLFVAGHLMFTPRKISSQPLTPSDGGGRGLSWDRLRSG